MLKKRFLLKGGIGNKYQRYFWRFLSEQLQSLRNDVKLPWLDELKIRARRVESLFDFMKH